MQYKSDIFFSSKYRYICNYNNTVKSFASDEGAEPHSFLFLDWHQPRRTSYIYDTHACPIWIQIWIKIPTSTHLIYIWFPCLISIQTIKAINIGTNLGARHIFMRPIPYTLYLIPHTSYIYIWYPCTHIFMAPTSTHLIYLWYQPWCTSYIYDSHVSFQYKQ